MALRNILKLGDEGLRKKSRRVETIDGKVVELLEDMAETMYKADGCGLAAPQVGILRRIAVVDVGDGLIELINPEITEQSGEESDIEGCLSVDRKRGYVKRPKKVKVEAYDRNGDLMEYTAEGYLARAFCHEIDHLDGILFIDKMYKVAEDE